MAGAEVVNVSLAKEFLKRGFRVDIIVAQDIEEERLLLPDSIRYFVLGTQRVRDFIRPFARYLRSEQPDVILASLWPHTVACVLAHRLAASKTRMVVWDHNTLSIQYSDRAPVHRWMLKQSIAWSYPLASERVAVSSGVAEDISALSGIARDRFSVIHNPLLTRPAVETNAMAAEAVWGGWRGPRIISVGRFKAQKNHALLIRAFKRLLGEKDARLLILGSGPLAEATAAVARAEGVREKVLMPGAVPDPTPYYLSADLFALSSDYEGFGNVIVEALSCGVPVVSTNCRSGPSEILENGRYGRLTPVRDVGALAAAMAEALAVDHDREALRRRAADFAPERIADQYLRLLFPERAGASAAASAK
jgi:glycosyltransferase involved in cell wall biosynthesis